MGETKIGGEVSNQKLNERLLQAEPRELTQIEIDGLTRIFVAIGRAWKNTSYDAAGLKSSWLEFVKEKTTRQPSYVAEYVSALRVVRELVKLEDGDEAKAFDKLFFEYKIPLVPQKEREPGKPSEEMQGLLDDFYGELEIEVPNPILKPGRSFTNPILDTRIAHAKHFVVDEFIRVQVIAGGFKDFIRPFKRIPPSEQENPPIQPANIVNYNGFIGGSRYARVQPVRPYEEPNQSDK